jgi:hypothetical protein
MQLNEPNMILPIFFLSLLIFSSAYAVIDAFRTNFNGRSTKGNLIFLIIILPFIGALFYFLIKPKMQAKVQFPRI